MVTNFDTESLLRRRAKPVQKDGREMQRRMFWSSLLSQRLFYCNWLSELQTLMTRVSGDLYRVIWLREDRFGLTVILSSAILNNTSPSVY